jgi:hypothetical protein
MCLLLSSQHDVGIHFQGGHEDYRDRFLKHAVKTLGIKYI